MSPRFPKYWPLAAALLLCIAPPALAQRVSAKDKAASGLLVERMATAEQRYRDALVLAANGDPKGTEESNAALEDMEDVVDACVKQRGCPVSDLLAKKGVPFKEIDVGGDSALRAEMTARASGRYTVPQIFIGETHVGGCDDLYTLEDAGKLDPLLTQPGSAA